MSHAIYQEFLENARRWDEEMEERRKALEAKSVNEDTPSHPFLRADSVEPHGKVNENVTSAAPMETDAEKGDTNAELDFSTIQEPDVAEESAAHSKFCTCDLCHVFEAEEA